VGAWAAVAGPVHRASEIQKNFASRSRLIVAGVAAAIAAVIAALLTVADFSFPAATVFAWLAVAVAVVGLFQSRGPLFPAALASLGLIGLGEILHGVLSSTFSPIIGAALLASAEFGYWSYELQAGVKHTNSAMLRRVAVIVGVVVVGAGLSGTLATLV
jgi:hypothetical protein